MLYPGADGRIVFEARDSRLGLTVDQTWGDGATVKPTEGEAIEKNPHEFYTSVRARSTVFRTGVADTPVFEFSENMYTRPTATSKAMAAGEVYERTFQANSAYVALTAPVAVTDYLANANIDGSGADRTGDLAVTVTDLGGARFRLKLEASAALYVTKLRIRGEPVEFYADRAEAEFALSVPGLKAGRALSFDVPFAGDTGNKLRDYAYQELRVGRYFWPTLTLPFRAAFQADILALLEVELGDLIKYKSPATNVFQTAGVDDWWYVEALEYSLPSELFGEVFDVVVTLIPSYVYRNLDAIAYDTFDRPDAVGALGTAFSGEAWTADSGFDINGGAARANTDALSVPDVSLATAAPAATIPQFDAASYSRQTSGTSLTFSHTVAANANRILVVGVSYRAFTNPTAQVSAITYNGVALTKSRRDTTVDRKTEIWYLKDPAAGAHDVVVTWTLDPADQVVGAASYYDVDQTTPIATDAGATGSSNTQAVSVAADTNQLIVGVVATYPGGGGMVPLAPGAGTTERWEDDSHPGGVGNIEGAGGDEAGSGGSTSIGWTNPGAADTWAISAVVLNPVGVYAPNDQVVEVSLSAIGTGDEVGLVSRKTDASNYYRAYIDKTYSRVCLDKVVGGVATSLNRNLLTNSGFELDAAGWGAGGTNTVARSTAQAKYGAASLKCTYADNSILARGTNVAVTAAAHVNSVWLYIPSDYNGTDLRMQATNFTGLTRTVAIADMSKRDQWQRLTATFTPLAGDLLGDPVSIFENGTLPTAGKFVYIDGAQCELGASLSQYVEFTVGTSHEIKAMIQGTRIRVWVDRRLYVDVTDSALTTGPRAGLMARNANGSTKFENFYAQGL